MTGAWAAVAMTGAATAGVTIVGVTVVGVAMVGVTMVGVTMMGVAMAVESSKAKILARLDQTLTEVKKEVWRSSKDDK